MGAAAVTRFEARVWLAAIASFAGLSITSAYYPWAPAIPVGLAAAALVGWLAFVAVRGPW